MKGLTLVIIGNIIVFDYPIAVIIINMVIINILQLGTFPYILEEVFKEMCRAEEG